MEYSMWNIQMQPVLTSEVMQLTTKYLNSLEVSREEGWFEMDGFFSNIWENERDRFVGNAGWNVSDISSSCAGDVKFVDFSDVMQRCLVDWRKRTGDYWDVKAAVPRCTASRSRKAEKFVFCPLFCLLTCTFVCLFVCLFVSFFLLASSYIFHYFALFWVFRFFLCFFSSLSMPCFFLALPFFVFCFLL
jgi:hypothetical protein